MAHDLKLIVGEEKVEIMVYHQVMSNASPVFHKMLLPDRFAEGYNISHNGFLELALQDDQAESMRVLCNIFHLRTNLIPKKQITSTIMADMATLVDKYDCATAVGLWPDIWKDQETIQKQITNVESMQFSDLTKWIHISAQLGYRDLFRTTTSTLIKETSEKDLREEPLLLEFKKLSQTLQGIFTRTKSSSIANGTQNVLKPHVKNAWTLFSQLVAHLLKISSREPAVISRQTI